MDNRAWRAGLMTLVVGLALAGCGLEEEEAPKTASAETNSPPMIGGIPTSTAVAGTSWLFQPSASDADGDALTFRATGLPGWASIDSVRGLVYGTPAATDVGTSGAIVISVSDGVDTAALPAFTITVSAATTPPPPTSNTAPSISGTPATSVAVGSAYGFVPTASDADGDTLSFSITGKPAGASFSAASGQLTWTPTAAEAGIYAGIVVTVTDGRGASASLPSFSITVTSPTVSGTATLSWAAPTQYTDGSTLPMDQLVGYRIYHGTSATALNEVIPVNNAATIGYVMNNLVAGTHYFAVTAVTVTGVESEWSEVRNKTIQ